MSSTAPRSGPGPEAQGPSVEAARTPEFGPGGYLPPRASKRARKIVLRAPMGLGWPLAALGASLVVVLVGAIFLLRSGPPGPPYVRIAAVTEIAPNTAVPRAAAGTDLLVVRAGGGLAVLVSPGAGVTWCPAPRQLERGTDVWTLDGAPRSRGTAGLAPVSSTVYEGMLFVDAAVLPSGGPVAPPPTSGDAQPVCTDP